MTEKIIFFLSRVSAVSIIVDDEREARRPSRYPSGYTSLGVPLGDDLICRQLEYIISVFGFAACYWLRLGPMGGCL